MTLSNFENLSGTTHNDNLSGDGNDNVLAGNAGDDTLFGGAGSDTLYGDGAIAADTHGLGLSGPIVTDPDAAATFMLTPGNDILDGGAGDDILNGGGGTDTASFASATGSVSVGLGATGNGSASHESGEFDQLFSIENLTGSAFHDSLLGNDGANLLDGGAGGDALFGRGGDDVMIGGEGNDFLRGSDGADVLDGGNGWDRVSSFVTAPTAGISFDLNIQGVAQDTGQGMDVLIGIEHASGTVLSDTLIGNSGSNWLWSGADATAGGGTGDDTINGGGGDDVVEVGSGNHTLAGGTGTDALSFLGGHYETTAAGVTYSLALQGAAQATEQGSMNTSGFENVSGSLYDDGLSGNSSANILAGDLGSDTLSGGDGDDTLYGDGRIWVDIGDTAGGSGPIALFGQQDDEPGLNEGDPDFVSGNDILIGGKGDDALYGGRGDDVMTGNQHNDRFIIEASSGDDRVTDFANTDTIVFAASSGVDDFADLTFTASGSRDTIISWGTSDSILVDGVRPHQFSASDFDFEAAALSARGDALFADSAWIETHHMARIAADICFS
jgi:Ca2+-binding RTX toxin-like protein